MEKNKIICHIVGADNNDKKIIKDFCNKFKKYDSIDLDLLNEEILKSEEMEKLFKQYNRFKKSNNDKYKETFKNMTKFWEESLILKVSNMITNKKKTILIGKNHHFRFVSKKIDFDVSNKFILDKDKKLITKNSIKNNIERNINNIINGAYPLENLDFNKQHKKLVNFEKTYTKSGYSKIKLDDILDILKFHQKNKIEGKGLWLSLNEEYNIGSLIHPNKSKIFGFTDPVLSLIDSFNFPNKESIYEIDTNGKKEKIKTLNIDSTKIDQLKKSRYIYYVSKENFIPSSKNNYLKYNTQNCVSILDREKVDNVYKKLKDLKLIE
tara:strand:- start:2 stop:970 length:969 start_codon:yes stop_codon:yes gene_type:complete